MPQNHSLPVAIDDGNWGESEVEVVNGEVELLIPSGSGARSHAR